ncbi:hypothetical protein Q5H92_24715 [Hymenobacter sp. M29]|uniref:Uncharacterized protein n=1 Tax=Hymenobacter mellowenesis TaxID=3063995 RepID=A0ABT9AJ42_9BACT|nr:hypothetical protein [Hymenobacter sp. M29]MDO7849588.1 hypothetical protein [Hymenobacter sp. M29]
MVWIEGNRSGPNISKMVQTFYINPLKSPADPLLNLVFGFELTGFYSSGITAKRPILETGWGAFVLIGPAAASFWAVGFKIRQMSKGPADANAARPFDNWMAAKATSIVHVAPFAWR